MFFGDFESVLLIYLIFENFRFLEIFDVFFFGGGRREGFWGLLIFCFLGSVDF